MSINNENFVWKIYKNILPQDVKDQWDNLTIKNPNSCASSSRIFCENLLPLIKKSEVYFAAGYINNNLKCLLPLTMTRRKFGIINIKHLSLINHSHLDLFIAAKLALTNENQAVISLKTILKKEINDWDYFSAKNWLLFQPIDKHYIKQMDKKQSAYFDIKNVNDISSLTGKKLIKNLMRLEKKLITSHESLSLEQLNKPAEIQHGLKAFYQIESSGWKGVEGSAIGMSPKIEGFYNKTWQEFSEHDCAKIFLLIAKDKTIACAIAFEHFNNLYIHKIAYLEAYNTYSPGSLLIKKILGYAIADTPIKTVFLNTDPLWAQRWHPQKHQLKTIQFFNKGIKSFGLKALYKIYLILKNKTFIEK